MRVCYFGLFDPEYPRNAILRRGLEAAGHEVLECREALELGETPSLLPVRRTRNLARRFAEAERPDVIVVPEFNQAIAPLAKWLAWKNQLPLVVDFLVSLYDTAVRDRGQSRWRRRSQLLGLADRASLRVADRVITESDANARYFAQLYGQDTLRKTHAIHIGAPEWQFTRTPLPSRGDRPLRVLYFGSFIPLHGVEHIVRAAKTLEDDRRFEFLLVGQGQTRAFAEAEAKRLGAKNVRFEAYAPVDDLLVYLRDADICLGVFGTTEKASRIVGNKVWQSLASGRPLITGDGPAAREVLVNEKHCLLVPFGNSAGIAEAVRRLADDADLARRLADAGADYVRASFSSTALGLRFASVLAEAIEARR
jgi:glycosyltransferase involved in cell wall biosynthesis